MASSRYVVVVLPFVPVMPTTESRSDGMPKRREDARASAVLVSSTTTCGTRTPGILRVPTMTAAPRDSASAAKS